MLISYNDDSGTHCDARVVCMCGFLADADEWSKLDEAWQTILDKPSWPSRIRAFHTVDCVHEEKEFASWNYAHRLALFGELVDVIMASPVRAIGAAVIAPDFDSLSESDRALLRADKSNTALEFTVRYLMEQIVKRGYENWPSENIGVVFENCDRGKEAMIRDFYIDYRDGFYQGERLMRNPVFLDKSESPLQAADVLAYSTYQIVMQRYFPREFVPHFDVIPPFMRMLEGILHGGGLYDAEVPPFAVPNPM
jgi:hypothetical protein